MQIKIKYLRSQGNLDVNTRLELESSDLSNNLGGRVQVNQTLVDAHLVAIPGLGTLTVGRLSGGNLKNLGRHANGALGRDLLGTGNGVGTGTGKNIGRDYKKNKLALRSMMNSPVENVSSKV